MESILWFMSRGDLSLRPRQDMSMAELKANAVSDLQRQVFSSYLQRWRESASLVLDCLKKAYCIPDLDPGVRGHVGILTNIV